MKKVIIFSMLALSFGGLLFSQEQSGQTAQGEEADYYYVNVPIEKIFIHRLGYVVTYRNGFSMASAYIPMEWFAGNSGKGEMIGLGSGNEWPSMTVYYIGGEFSFVRLKVRRNRSHQSWGVVPFGANIDSSFEGVEELNLQL